MKYCVLVPKLRRKPLLNAGLKTIGCPPIFSPQVLVGNLHLQLLDHQKLSEFSDKNEKDQSLSEALFRRKPAACKGKKPLVDALSSSKQQMEKSTESSGDEDLAFSESLFF